MMVVMLGKDRMTYEFECSRRPSLRLARFSLCSVSG